jgi:hypothetical protein
MNKCYMKLFPRLLNTSFPEVMIMCRNDTGKTIISCHAEFS